MPRFGEITKASFFLLRNESNSNCNVFRELHKFGANVFVDNGFENILFCVWFENPQFY